MEPIVVRYDLSALGTKVLVIPAGKIIIGEMVGAGADASGNSYIWLNFNKKNVLVFSLRQTVNGVAIKAIEIAPYQKQQK